MGDQYLELIIRNRDYESLAKYLEIEDPSDIIEYLLDHLIEIVDECTKEPRMISEIISFCYLIMHNNPINIVRVSRLISKTKSELNKLIIDAIKADLKEKRSNAARANDKIKLLIDSANYLKESGNSHYEVDLLWYVITELKDYNLAKYLINMKSACLQIEKDGYNLLEMFVLYFLNHLDDDYTYNREVLYLLLVTKSFNLDAKKIDRLVKLIDSFDIKNPRVLEIRNIIIDAFEDSELLTTSYCCKYVKPKENMQLLSNDPIINREDFRKYYTVSIDSQANHHKNRFCIDDAFTLVKKDSHYLLYVHITDIPSFIEINSSMDREIRNIFISSGNKDRYRSLFNGDMAFNQFSLNQNVDRRTITIGVEIDSTGNIIDYRFYNGIIRNYHSYLVNEVNELFVNNNPLIKEYYDLASLINGEEVINAGQIVEIFNKLFGCLASKTFASNNYPGIFHNCPLINSIVSSDHFDSLDNYACQNISPTYLDRIKKSYATDTLKIHGLTCQNHLGMDGEPYMQFTSPIRNYTNIANLRGLREMIIFGNNDPATIEFYHKYYEELVARANADYTVLKLK